MGFLTGLLGGLADQFQTERQRQDQLAQQEQLQQQSVYKTLLGSDNPELQALGLTGLMEKPEKNFMGRLKKSPNYEKVRQVIDRISQHKADLEGSGGAGAVPSAKPPGPPPSPPQGLQAPPPTPAAAAMPDAAPATGGGGATGPATPSPALAAGPAGAASPPSAAGIQGEPPPLPAAPPAPPPPPDLMAQLSGMDPLGLNQRVSMLREKAQLGQALHATPEEMKHELMPSSARMDASEAGRAAKLEIEKFKAENRAKETSLKIAADREKQTRTIQAANERTDKMVGARYHLAEMTGDRQEVGRINRLRGEQVKIDSAFQGADVAMQAIGEAIQTYDDISIGHPVDKYKAFSDYTSKIDGLIASVSAAAGENPNKGFTNKDADRMKALLKPSDAYNVFSADWAKDRLKEAYGILDEVRDRRIKAYQAEIERGPSRAGSAPAPAPSKSGSKMDSATAGAGSSAGPPPSPPAQLGGPKKVGRFQVTVSP